MHSNLPRAQAGSFLTLHYRLAGPAGDVLNTFAEKPATMTLGQQQLSPALEQCLMGMEEGSRAIFELPAGAAFGERDPAMRQWLPRKELVALGEASDTYEVGEVVQFPTPDGQGKFAGVVLEVRADGAVQFDFNHPLAGHPVSFEVQLIGVL